MAYFFDSRITIQEGGEVNATDDKVVSGKTVYDAILDIVYPIGSVYLSVNNISPQTFLGGTWISIGSGRTLVGVDTNDADFNTVEKTGGSKTKTLITDNLPAHNHTASSSSSFAGTAVNTGYMSANATHNHVSSRTFGVGGSDPGWYSVASDDSKTGGGGNFTTGTTNTNHYHSVTAAGTVSTTTTVNNTGSGTAFDVVNPYFTVYFWKRTA